MFERNVGALASIWLGIHFQLYISAYILYLFDQRGIVRFLSHCGEGLSPAVGRMICDDDIRLSLIMLAAMI